MGSRLIAGLLGAAAAGLSLSAAGAAAAPRLAADIAPVHSLAAMVTEGVVEPALIMPPGSSPHGYAMRPSEAAALAEADVVFWVGPSLTPWLERAIDALAGTARVATLASAPGVETLHLRESAEFPGHDHGEEHEAERHDGEQEEGGRAHGEHGAHDHGHADAGHGHDHADDHAAHGGHDHGGEGIDPHMWLDPANARAWVSAMAATLAAADPENAAAYLANAARADAELAALSDELAETLAPVADRPFMSFHDGFHYLEHRYGLNAVGAVALSDAATPGAAGVAAARDRLTESDAVCLFAEPQFPDDLVQAVISGTDARTGALDPIGATLTPGPDLYPALMRGLAASLVDCLGAKS